MDRGGHNNNIVKAEANQSLGSETGWAVMGALPSSTFIALRRAICLCRESLAAHVKVDDGVHRKGNREEEQRLHD